MENMYLKRSKELLDETIANRRVFHGYAETGMEVVKTSAYVVSKLKEIGVEPTLVGDYGVSCVVGSGVGKTILLRADMDALPMAEESGLDFAATNGNCHSCGHDAHTSMLLTAVKMVKEREEFLNGNVKFVFQPGEEVLQGALSVIENGILQNPTVDAAISTHISVGLDISNVGQVAYSVGPSTLSGTSMVVEVTGCAAHGSTPEAGVDAITIASHIVINLQEVIAREVSCFDNVVLLVGTISGGTTSNTVAGEARLGISVRTATYEMDEYIQKRVGEIASTTAALFRGTAKTYVEFGAPPLVTDVTLAKEMAEAATEVVGSENIIQIPPKCFGEDFAYIAKEVPSAIFHIGVGGIDEGFEYGLHHPKMRIDENGLAVGAAIYAHCAEAYVNKK